MLWPATQSAQGKEGRAQKRVMKEDEDDARKKGCVYTAISERISPL